MKSENKMLPFIGMSEFYQINKAMTNKDKFILNEKDGIAETSLIDSKKDINIEIANFFNENPNDNNLQSNELIKKLIQRLEALDQSVRDTYLILGSHWYKNKAIQGMTNEGKAIIWFEDIHMNYKGYRGTNIDSTLKEDDRVLYRKAIDVLANTRIKINIQKENNPAYNELKLMGVDLIEGALIERAMFLYKKGKVAGVSYDLGVLGEHYNNHIPDAISESLPQDLLKLDKRYAVTKNIGYFFCNIYQHYKQEKIPVVSINLESLMVEVCFEIKRPRIQEGLNNFLKHFFRAIDILKKAKIIESYDMPPLNSKNYQNTLITIVWCLGI